MKAMLSWLLVCLCVSFFAYATPISLVWQTNAKTSWEEDWLKEVLEGVDLKVVYDGKYKKMIDHSIVVLSSAHNFSGSEAYLKKMHRKKYVFGVILISDERYTVPSTLYKYAKFVFRNYWHKDLLSYGHVNVFPLGYKRGFWQGGYVTPKTASQRDFVWSFAGQITRKPTREAMIAHLKEIPNFHIHETFAWADPNSLDTLSYRNLLLDTVFAPCPTGWWNLDSFRVYESLECGCIPIVERTPIDYFGKYFGDHPFLVVDSWDQAPALMNALLSDPVALEQRRQQCYDWWQTYKYMKKQELTGIIKRTFSLN